MGLLNKIIKKASFVLSKKGIELYSISKKQRGSTFVTHIMGRPLIANDPMSFLGQYRDIIERNSYDFKSVSYRPYIIDCGSNIGLSIIQHKINHPHAEIVGFEADPEIYKVLKKNLESFGIQDVHVEQAAIWTYDGEIDFLNNGAAAGKINELGSGNSLRVKAIDLNTYLTRKVDLLKIDIEGGETALIKHISQSLQNVQNIFIEYHSSVNQNQSLADILFALQTSGFRYYLEAADVF
jgi:FkbM family methyltransferase